MNTRGYASRKYINEKRFAHSITDLAANQPPNQTYLSSNQAFSVSCFLTHLPGSICIMDHCATKLTVNDAPISVIY